MSDVSKGVLFATAGYLVICFFERVTFAAVRKRMRFGQKKARLKRACKLAD